MCWGNISPQKTLTVLQRQETVLSSLSYSNMNLVARNESNFVNLQAVWHLLFKLCQQTSSELLTGSLDKQCIKCSAAYIANSLFVMFGECLYAIFADFICSDPHLNSKKKKCRQFSKLHTDRVDIWKLLWNSSAHTEAFHFKLLMNRLQMLFVSWI